MVDEASFREVWAGIDTLPCGFAKALLGGHAECRHAQRHHLAERVGIGCGDSTHHALCAHLLDRLRREARFALETVASQGRLTHAQALQLQVGTLRGLVHLQRDTVGSGDARDDVVALFTGALARYGTLDAVPVESLIREIAHYIPRHARGRR